MKQTQHLPARETGQRRGAAAGLLALAAILVLTGALRYRLLDVPLERDEGGFAYVASLVLDGIPPYTQAYDYKPPGLYVAYAAFIAAFGGGPRGVHAGLLLMSLLSAAMLYVLVRTWSDPAGGAVAALLLGVLSLSPSVLGFAAHATHFVIFWGLAGTLLVERYLRSPHPLYAVAAGAAFGCATLMKHPGILLFAYGAAAVFIAGRESRKGPGRRLGAIALLLAGFLLPVACVAAWLGGAGALRNAFYWIAEYPAMVAGGSDATGLLDRFIRNGLQSGGSFLPLWLAAAAGFLWLMMNLPRSGAPSGAPVPGETAGPGPSLTRARFGAFFSLSVAAVFVGYETRSHYFVLMLPALAAAAGVAVAMARSRVGSPAGRALLIALPCLLAALGIANEREYFLSAAPGVISRTIYHPNPFADAGQVAEFIRDGSTSGDRIAILGSEPEILFLAGRRSASRYIFTNFFNERHAMKARMEEEMAREIDSTRPAMIVMINQPFSWGAAINPGWPILRWADGYLAREYRLAAALIPATPSSSRFLAGDEALNDSDVRSATVLIFRRNTPNGDGRAPAR